MNILNSLNYYQNRLKSKYKTILDGFDNVYIFGAANLGKIVYDFCKSKNINVLGFIDNDEAKKIFLEKKVYQLNDLPKNALIIHSVSFGLVDVTDQLIENGYHNFIPFNVLASLGYLELDFHHGLMEDIFRHKEEYLKAYNNLEDERSREVFRALVDFRLMPDKVLDKDLIATEPYFDIVDLNGVNVFVDGGGYNGDSSLGFIQKKLKRGGSFEKIYFFEPEGELLEQAKENLKGYRNIKYFAKGLYDKSTTLRFSETGAGSGNISEKGAVEIETVAIDEIIEKADFIKLDIEGAELKALKGAEKLIKNHKPILAISAYHKPEDLWKIMQEIQKIRPDYKFQLRHYTQTIFDSVLYAL